MGLSVAAVDKRTTVAVDDQQIVVDVMSIQDPVVIEISTGIQGPPGPQGPPGAVPEAPIDGNLYARKDGTWVPAPTGTGLPAGGTPGQALVIDGASNPVFGAPIDGSNY